MFIFFTLFDTLYSYVILKKVDANILSGENAFNAEKKSEYIDVGSLKTLNVSTKVFRNRCM